MSRLSFEERRQHYRREFLNIVERMKPGECLNVHERELKEYFPGGYGGFAGTTFKGTSEEEFLSACMGSAYGTVRIQSNHVGAYVISKHEADEREDGARYHVDADRQYLYERRADGLWIRNDVPYVRGER